MSVLVQRPATPFSGIDSRRGAGSRGSDTDPVEAVRTALSLPGDQLDYARTKLAFDRIIEPSVDAGAVLRQLDGLAARGRRMAGCRATTAAKLAALRKLIYESGPWNGHRPFDYDHDNFLDLRSKLISTYLRTRRGNCVSMPVLFLILADKLGIDMRLSTAPHHILLRYQDRGGTAVNLEATSGANRARDVWVQQERGVSDRAIESGLYLRTLSRRESVALMATTVIEHLNNERRFEESIAVCDIILRNNPRCGHTLANLGNACFKILRHQFLDKYGSQLLIPLPLRARYLLLCQRNQAAFAAAAALGWEPNGLIPAR